MDLFTRLERTLERFFEGMFAQRFRGRVQPVEVARRLTRSMEDSRMVSVNKTFAPNEFDVSLHPEDYRTIALFEAAIVPELERHVHDSARESGMDLLGRPMVRFVQNDTVERGDMRIEARFVRQEEQAPRIADSPTSDLRVIAAPAGRVPGHHAILEVIEGPDLGQTYSLTHPLTSIGRGAPNDIALTDSSVSRAHAEIALEPDGFHLKDLGSKNGSLVNGAPVSDVLLSDGDQVAVGATVFRFNAARVL